MAHLFLFAVPIFACALSVILGVSFRRPYSSKWWLLRLAAVPTLCTLFVLFNLNFPSEIALDQDSNPHGNLQESDFTPIMWSIVLPILYLIVATPLCVVFALWKRAR